MRVFLLVLVLLFGWLDSWPAVQLTSNALVEQREEGAPVNCTQPAADQGALIHEAEKGRFTLRRMELIGNASTPDDLLHSRIASRMEVGNLFTRQNLVASLRNVSRLKTIYPVTMKNIVVELSPAEKTLDLRICIKERSQSVRRRQLTSACRGLAGK
jgi:hypothetical protein